MSQNVNAGFVLFLFVRSSCHHRIYERICVCLVFYLKTIILFSICTQTVSVVNDAFDEKNNIEEKKSATHTRPKKTQHKNSRKAHHKPFRAKWKEWKKAYGVRFFSSFFLGISRAHIWLNRVYINRTLHIPCRLQCYREYRASVCTFLWAEWINYVYGTSAQSI